MLRGAVVFCGAAATAIGLTVTSVYALWYLCSDFVYVTLFPQLVCVIYAPFVNGYGVLAGFFTGLLLRLLGGDATLGLPPTIPFHSNFPFKTLAMAVNFLLTIMISLLALLIFKKWELDRKFDVLNAYPAETVQRVKWEEIWTSSSFGERPRRSQVSPAEARDEKEHPTIYSTPV